GSRIGIFLHSANRATISQRCRASLTPISRFRSRRAVPQNYRVRLQALLYPSAQAWKPIDLKNICAARNALLSDVLESHSLENVASEKICPPPNPFHQYAMACISPMY